MYDYKRIISDKVPCFFWDCNENRSDNYSVGHLEQLDSGNFMKMESQVIFLYCEPIRTEDQLEYRLKEKKYRACENWEEIKPFWYRTVKVKNNDEYFDINHIELKEACTDYSNPEFLFNYCELLEPVNGSTVIGVEITEEK